MLELINYDVTYKTKPRKAHYNYQQITNILHTDLGFLSKNRYAEGNAMQVNKNDFQI